MPVNFTPWRTIQNSSSACHAGTRSGRKGGAGVMPLMAAERRRSEEHTSELQSLMRISYAVFCLKKKNKQDQTNIEQQTTTRDVNHILRLAKHNRRQPTKYRQK